MTCVVFAGIWLTTVPCPGHYMNASTLALSCHLHVVAVKYVHLYMYCCLVVPALLILDSFGSCLSVDKAVMRWKWLVVLIECFVVASLLWRTLLNYLLIPHVVVTFDSSWCMYKMLLLQLFTEYGRLAMEDGGETPFQVGAYWYFLSQVALVLVGWREGLYFWFPFSRAEIIVHVHVFGEFVSW